MKTRLHRTRHESAMAMFHCIREIWNDINTTHTKLWEVMQTAEYTKRHRVTTIPKRLIADIMTDPTTPPTLDDAIALRREIIDKDRPRKRRVRRQHITGDSFPEFVDDAEPVEFESDPDEQSVIAANIARFGTTYHPDDVAFKTPGNVQRFREITARMADTYERKNADYGNSFGESIGEFGAVAGVVRIGDKFNRLKNLIKNPDSQRVNDESVSDTLLDMANYCIMLHIELTNPFNK